MRKIILLIILSLALIGMSGASLMDPNTGFNWSKPIHHSINLYGNPRINVSNVTHLETYAGTNATAIETLQTDLGNNVSKISTLEGYEHITAFNLGSPIVDTAIYVLNTQEINDTGPWNFTTMDAQPDIPRSLTVTPNTTISATFAFHGTDIADAATTETLTFTASSTAQETGRAFKTVDYCIVTKTAGSNATFTVGVGGRLGLSIKLTDTAQVLAASINNVREGTFPTVTASTTQSLNTVDLSSATAGTPVKVYVMA